MNNNTNYPLVVLILLVIAGLVVWMLRRNKKDISKIEKRAQKAGIKHDSKESVGTGV